MYGFVMNPETYERFKKELHENKDLINSISPISSFWGTQVICHPNQVEPCVECKTAEAMATYLHQLDDEVKPASRKP